MKHWIRLFIALFVIPASVAGLLMHLNRHGFFDLERIEIVLLDAPGKPLHLKPLVDQLDRSLEMYRGQSLWSLDLEDMSKKIGGLNWIETHALSRGWPSTLTVKVKPFDVKALYLGRGNRFVPIIHDGKLLDPVEPMLAPDVPILEGAIFQARSDLRRSAIDMLGELPADGSFSRRSISEIRWDAKEGFRVKMTKSGIDVKLGDDRFGIKSARVGQVIDYLGNRNIRAKSIDANLSKKVFVKLEDPSNAQHLE